MKFTMNQPRTVSVKAEALSKPNLLSHSVLAMQPEHSQLSHLLRQSSYRLAKPWHAYFMN